MRDIEFRQLRSFEGLPDGGPCTQQQRASHTIGRFIDYVAELPETRTETSGLLQDRWRPRTVCLWHVLSDLITPQPKSVCRPFLPPFDSGASMMEAGTLPVGTAFRAGELRRTRPAGNSHARIWQDRRWPTGSEHLAQVLTDNFRFCNGPFPVHVPPWTARRSYQKIQRRKVAHNQIGIEVKRLRPRKSIQYTFQCRKATLAAATYVIIVLCREGML